MNINRKPYVSIIVPIFNSQKTLRNCLKSLQKIQGHFDFEVVVVDNNSTDESVQIAAEFANVRLERESTPGAGSARNKGIESVKGEIIAFTDSDCCVHPNWIADLLPHLLNNPKLAGVGGDIISGSFRSPVSNYIDYRGMMNAQRLAKGSEFQPPFLLTCNALFKKKALLEVDRFKNIWPAEDADLCIRLGKIGWEIQQFSGKGIVYHYHRETLNSLLKMAYTYGKGSANLMVLHPDLMPASYWIQGSLYTGIAKGLAKLPFAYQEKGPMHQRRALYDLLTNAALLLGRLSISVRKGRLIL